MAFGHQEPGSVAEPESRRHVDAGGPWVLVCGLAELCAEARREIARHRQEVRTAAAEGLERARELLQAGELPAVILAEERALAGDAAGLPLRQRRQAIAGALSLLASYAPVVWIGNAADAAEIAGAMAGLPVDFVPRAALCVPAAVSMVERRLHGSAGPFAAGATAGSPLSLHEADLEGRDFGEVLRHELNNPLTGILGNAELLLLEVRRGRLEIPAHNLQRLETITDLAVRMRETVRLLSDRWRAAEGSPTAGKEPAIDPHWPANP